MMEYFLSRSEMLGLMAVVGVSLIVGIDNDRLIPSEQTEQRVLSLQGVESLRQKGLIQRNGGVETLNGNLSVMGLVMAFPQLLTIITKDTPGVGQQQFLHYRSDPVNMELTMPTIDQYRLASLADSTAALARVCEILPVAVREDSLRIDNILSQDAFFLAKNQVEADNWVAAHDTLTNAGFTSDLSEPFLNVLHRPLWGGTVAYIRVVDQQANDARNLAIVSDSQVTWLIRQQTSGESDLRIQSVTAEEYLQILITELNSVIS